MPGADRTDSYTPVAKLLHWLTALLVLGLLGVGLWMVGLPLGLTKLYAYAWHKWIGLTRARAHRRCAWLWRAVHAAAARCPPTVTAWERSAGAVGARRAAGAAARACRSAAG